MTEKTTEKLKKINRKLICNLTGNEIIVKPDKYEKLLNFYLTEEKVKENFICHQGEKNVKNPEFEFWLLHCTEMVTFKDTLFYLISKFNDSDRNQQDVLELQTKATELLNANNLKYEFTLGQDERGKCVNGIKLKNLPFIKKDLTLIS